MTKEAYGEYWVHAEKLADEWGGVPNDWWRENIGDKINVDFFDSYLDKANLN